MSLDRVSPPPDQDLPAGARTALRDRIVAAATAQPTRATRRWRAPFAAAAAVLLIGLGWAAIAARSYRPAQPTSPAVVRRLDPATLAERCGLPGAAQLVRSEDSYGGIALITKDGTVRACDLNLRGEVASFGDIALKNFADLHHATAPLGWGGRATVPSAHDSSCMVRAVGVTPPISVSAPISPTRGLLALSPPPTGQLPTCRSGFSVYGATLLTAFRVTVAFGGYPAVEAAVNEGWFAVRDFPSNDNGKMPVTFVVRTYDAHGTLLSRIVSPY